MNAIEKAGLNLAEACVEPSCKPAAMLDLLGVWTGPSALFWELTVKRRINVSHKKSKRMNIWEPSLKVCKASHKYIVNTLTDGFPREEKSYVILKAHFLQTTYSVCIQRSEAEHSTYNLYNSQLKVKESHQEQSWSAK